MQMLMTILNNCINFFTNNYQAIIIGVISSLVASGLIAWWLIWIFRVPEFELYLDYIPGKMTEAGYSVPVLDIGIFNKKWKLGFSKEEILFGLVVPVDFIENKEWFLITTEGRKKWIVDTRGKQVFSIKGKDYYLYRGSVNLPVYPQSRTHFVRIAGNFDSEEILRVYYYFETPFGNFPNHLKFGERVKNIENGKLPYSEITISPDPRTSN